MTNKELIEELQNYPDDMVVVFDDNELDLVPVKLVEQIPAIKSHESYLSPNLYRLFKYKEKNDTEESVIVLRGNV